MVSRVRAASSSRRAATVLGASLATTTADDGRFTRVASARSCARNVCRPVRWLRLARCAALIITTAEISRRVASHRAAWRHVASRRTDLTPRRRREVTRSSTQQVTLSVLRHSPLRVVCCPTRTVYRRVAQWCERAARAATRRAAPCRAVRYKSIWRNKSNCCISTRPFLVVYTQSSAHLRTCGYTLHY